MAQTKGKLIGGGGTSSMRKGTLPGGKTYQMYRAKLDDGTKTSTGFRDDPKGSRMKTKVKRPSDAKHTSIVDATKESLGSKTSRTYKKKDGKYKVVRSTTEKTANNIDFSKRNVKNRNR